MESGDQQQALYDGDYTRVRLGRGGASHVLRNDRAEEVGDFGRDWNQVSTSAPRQVRAILTGYAPVYRVERG